MDIDSPTETIPIMSTEKIAWPQWDGTTTSFPFFLARLKIRAKAASKVASTDGQIVCYQMVETLPAYKQHLVAQWFTTGGKNRDWDWEEFAEHFALQFEDKQARKAAIEELSRMRQGASQYFTEYVSDFEYKLSVADGMGWNEEAKLGFLESGINKALRSALVTVVLPEGKYNDWITAVKLVAGKLESLADYRPKGSTTTKTWYLPQPGTAVHYTPNPQPPASAPRLDHQGDTVMGNSDIQLLQSLINVLQGQQSMPNPQSHNRPRAPWRDAAAFAALVAQGVCSRCERPGHFGRNCPHFRPALNPQGNRRGPGVAAMNLQPPAAAGREPGNE